MVASSVDSMEIDSADWMAHQWVKQLALISVLLLVALLENTTVR
jgi:hypothetical protein